MKNGKLVTAYLDFCEMRRQKWEIIKDNAELLEQDNDNFGAENVRGQRLFDACLDDGWTTEELEAIYERRFGYEPGYVARLRSKQA